MRERKRRGGRRRKKRVNGGEEDEGGRRETETKRQMDPESLGEAQTLRRTRGLGDIPLDGRARSAFPSVEGCPRMPPLLAEACCSEPLQLCF